MHGGEIHKSISQFGTADEFMEHAIQNGIRQIVLLAAGMDTRAFRLQVIPVDFPSKSNIEFRSSGYLNATQCRFSRQEP